MIKFRRLFDLTLVSDIAKFDEIRALFATAFPAEAEAIDRIARIMREPLGRKFEPLLIIAEDHRDKVTGLAFVYYFSELRYGYLQYIASDPAESARGIGGALYEAMRDLLAGKGANGLFLDVPPDDPAKLDDPARVAINRRRLKFYERFGASPIVGTLWDVEPNPRNDGFLTLLLYDPLGRRGRLRATDARRVVRAILTCQYHYEPNDPFVEKIVRSFRQDPVQLRPISAEVEPAAAIPPRRGAYLKPISMVVADGHAIHHLREKGYVERPVRVRQILRGVADLPLSRIPFRHFPDSHILSVHDPKLVHYLRAVSQRLGPKAIVYPEVFPIRRPDRAPKALEDRAGYFCADTFTPITHNVYPAAREAADVALTAAALVLGGERFAYALCRPPGHHAERRIFGGFCFLNNSAIAAHYLSAHGKVALLDIDYHHGNGGQDIFYERNDVYTLSIHGHPRHAYPNFSGYTDERGEGPGRGFNRNYPLEPPVDDERYIKILDDALAVIRRFAPRYLVVSLGFDIMKGDPTGSFAISLTGLRRI
ncbi:MAG: histone deacetylase family protein, partial [Alphaproteobacteria bacterium]|nr:histone deacetylase family protein [Alphaproteobacteria bacterium]